MKKVEEQKHFLALMARPGDYIFIDIARLDLAGGYSPRTLADIDAFTMHFNVEEIKSSIKRANMASDKYLEGLLVIQDNQKHNPLNVIDKNYYKGFQIDAYLKEKCNDKELINTIINKFRSICEIPEVSINFTKAIRFKNIELALDILFDLPYINIRKFIVFLIELRDKELEKKSVINQERIRDKAA